MFLDSLDSQHGGISTVAVICSTTAIESVIFDHGDCWAFSIVPASEWWLFIEMAVKHDGPVRNLSLNFCEN